MERICFVFELKPDAVGEYKRRHDKIWPEMTALLDQAGISDYSIYNDGTMLYGFFKVEPNWATAKRILGASDIQRSWTAAMDDLIAWQLDANGQLRLAQEVFRHEGKQAGPRGVIIQG